MWCLSTGLRCALQPQELAGTLVLALSITEASAKVRTEPPIDAPEDYALPIWAGEIPLRLVASIWAETN